MWDPEWENESVSAYVGHSTTDTGEDELNAKEKHYTMILMKHAKGDTGTGRTLVSDVLEYLASASGLCPNLFDDNIRS